MFTCGIPRSKEEAENEKKNYVLIAFGHAYSVIASAD
jgi:hypothetical protein